jgi:hypothetical protein
VAVNLSASRADKPTFITRKVSGTHSAYYYILFKMKTEETIILLVVMYSCEGSSATKRSLAMKNAVF